MSSASQLLLHVPQTLDKLLFSPPPRWLCSPDATRHRPHNDGDEEEDRWNAPVDIVEGPTSYVFYVDVPGLSKSDIQVTLEEERVMAALLVVRSRSRSNVNGGKRKREEGEEEGCRYLRLERRASRKLERKFRLPEDANPAGITAKCENGVLTVRVEKVAIA